MILQVHRTVLKQTFSCAPLALSTVRAHTHSSKGPKQQQQQQNQYKDQAGTSLLQKQKLRRLHEKFEREQKEQLYEYNYMMEHKFSPNYMDNALIYLAAPAIYMYWEELNSDFLTRHFDRIVSLCADYAGLWTTSIAGMLFVFGLVNRKPSMPRQKLLVNSLPLLVATSYLTMKLGNLTSIFTAVPVYGGLFLTLYAIFATARDQGLPKFVFSVKMRMAIILSLHLTLTSYFIFNCTDYKRQMQEFIDEMNTKSQKEFEQKQGNQNVQGDNAQSPTAKKYLTKFSRI